MKDRNEPKKEMAKKWKREDITFLLRMVLPVVIALILYLTAWVSPGFCDWYSRYIFPIWGSTYGRITELLPFSLGELLLYLGVLLLLIGLIWGIASAVLRIVCRGRTPGISAYVIYLKTLGQIISAVLLIMVLNCFILYHCPTFGERYPAFYEGTSPDAYETARRVILLHDYMTGEANELAKVIHRDEKGQAICEIDMEEEAIRDMKSLGERYDLLQGFYPRPKRLLWSSFFSQQSIMGYYFPFSMEANYNALMQPCHMPVTMCHELSHLKGFIYEDEANLIGYLACMESEEPFFRYSAYLSVLGYLQRDYDKVMEALEHEDESVRKDLEALTDHAEMTDLVKYDRAFLTAEAWAQVKKHSPFSTKTVSKAADAFLNANLKWNGIADGTISYSRVVDWLLIYYEKEGLFVNP